jgi:hypothetical protein
MSLPGSVPPELHVLLLAVDTAKLQEEQAGLPLLAAWVVTPLLLLPLPLLALLPLLLLLLLLLLSALLRTPWLQVS